ncbi:hypothetical protein LTR17_011109 [Elasticomyces elasticus]|nr:hypothetical protein LTR17_011109 [Elasticomyces elasticus]
MTLNKVVVNLNNSFEAQQVYVALSRAKSLGGLKVISLAKGLEGKGMNVQVKQFLEEHGLYGKKPSMVLDSYDGLQKHSGTMGRAHATSNTLRELEAAPLSNGGESKPKTEADERIATAMKKPKLKQRTGVQPLPWSDLQHSSPIITEPSYSGSGFEDSANAQPQGLPKPAKRTREPPMRVYVSGLGPDRIRPALKELDWS